MNKAVLIFSGYNQRTVIAFLRTLEANNIKYGIIASSKEDTIFLTSYKNKVLSVRSEKQLSIGDITNSINECKNVIGVDEYILAPSTEALNRFLSLNRLLLADINCVYPVVEDTLYEDISDKYKFGDLCKSNGILVPGEYKNISESPYPFVAKPIKYCTDNGSIFTPFLINNDTDKKNFLNQCNPEDFYFQEFISGKCLYILYYFYKNGEVLKFSQENKIQQPGGKSMIAAESSVFHDSSESLKYENLFKKAGYYGLVMVEVKEDKGRYYMIEANPRFWGPSQLFVDAKVNFFEAFLFENGLLDKKPVYSADKITKYFWYGGLVEARKNKGNIAYHGYSKELFDKEYDAWMSVDVYNREDTKELFEQEVNNK